MTQAPNTPHQAAILTLCSECDLTQIYPSAPPGSIVHCCRCGHHLHRQPVPSGFTYPLALTVTGLILFVIANSAPFLSFQMQGQVTDTTFLTGVLYLYQQQQWLVATIVLLTIVITPLVQLMILLMVLWPLHHGRQLGAKLIPHLRWLSYLNPWIMMDVFIIAILVAVVKLSEMATIVPGISLFAFALLILVLAAIQANLHPEWLWARVQPQPPIITKQPLLICAMCGMIIPDNHTQTQNCPRCHKILSKRRPFSLQRTWALVLTAFILYIPANVYPIMSVTSLGATQSDTILSGVFFLFHHGLWPLATVVFIASIVVPLLKLILLVILLWSVQYRLTWQPDDRTRLYRITEAIGRWSMVDIYVVTILVALVRLGNLASIQAETGAVFFCAVVVVTMLAAMQFDPRLIWDSCEATDFTSSKKQ
jgi:paraquat-inducible protein A